MMIRKSIEEVGYQFTLSMLTHSLKISVVQS